MRCQERIRSKNNIIWVGPTPTASGILGSSSSVEKTLASASEDYDRCMRLKASDIDLEVVMNVVCDHLGVDPAKLSGPSRR